MKTEKFIVGKMKCMGCVGKITAGLSEIKGVSNVDADLGSSSITVSYDGEDLRDEILKKLEAIGYPANLDVKQNV